MTSRATKAASIWVIAVLILTGCTAYISTPSWFRGQTSASAIETLEGIDGIASASFEADLWEEHTVFGPDEGMDLVLRVAVADDFHVDDPGAFLQYLFQTAWSINDKSPDGDVVIRLHGGVSPHHNWFSTLHEVYGSPSSNGVHATGMPPTFSADDRQLERLYGAWPSGAPGTPGQLIMPGAPDVVLPGPLFDIQLTAGLEAVGEEESVATAALFAERASTASGREYLGAVTMTVTQDGQAIGSETSLVDDDWWVIAEVPLPDAEATYTVRIEFEEARGFDTSPIEVTFDPKVA